MKRILNEFEFSDEQLNIVKQLSRECNLCVDTVKILYGRGFKDKDSILKFMNPSKDNFISPYNMSGMSEAVDLIVKARDEGWSVVVYGDYDADGICASTILNRVLKDFGIEAFICIPERSSGYGLSVSLIDEIFENYFPQLFITVDCGISGYKEVEYIKENGAEVIITDHHELPEILPECICINPKFNDNYKFDNLCGAGVAFKLGCALIGEEAYKYLDFAAIATIADSVPLTGENRDIVSEGLKIINTNPRSCYAGFLSNSENRITSHTVAFSIAPKINAAGRMGDAKSALDLFNETDSSKIFTLSAKLIAYNLERQTSCEELYSSAKEMLRARAEIDKVIMLYNENWNPGFVGIVAARLVEEYGRPVILFVKRGNTLKGSARSVENVNIFTALRECSQYISEFGGHSQAAGVNIDVENFDKLYNALNDYIEENYKTDDFIPGIYINGQMKDGYSLKFVKELEKLEPFGIGNRSPLFMYEDFEADVKPVKPLSPHVSIKTDNLEFLFFGGLELSPVLQSPAPKKYIFEYNISSFRGKEYVKGFIRDVIYERDAGRSTGEENSLNCIAAMSTAGDESNLLTFTKKEIEEEMKSCGDFGTAFIAWDYSSINFFDNSERLNVELFSPTLKNGASVILVAPLPDVDFDCYKKVIFLDNPLAVKKFSSGISKSFGIYEKARASDFLNQLSCERDVLAKIFSVVSANRGILKGKSAKEVAKLNEFEFSKPQVMFALCVFEQLSLINFTEGGLQLKRGIKTDLNNSMLYRSILKIKA